MVTVKCLAILYLPMTSPTLAPIAAAPDSRPARTRAAIGSSSFSVAASRAARLRARSPARAGLRQAMSLSPGKSGELISARSCSSNRDSCSGPSPARSLRMAGARSAVIHPYFASSSLSALMRGGDHAAVADHDHPLQPEGVLDGPGDLGEGGGVGGVPLEHADRDRPALGVGEQPVLDLHLAFLAVAGVAARAERAAAALQPGG